MFALANKTTKNVTKTVKKLIKTYGCLNTMISDNAAELTLEAVKKVMSITRYKETGSCTISPEFERICRKGNQQNPQNLLRGTRNGKLGRFSR